VLIRQTAEKLRKLRLYGMAECLLNQRTPNSDLSFEEQLGLLVDYEWTCRQNRRLQRLLKEAKLKINACMEDIDYQHPRNRPYRYRQNFSYLCTWQYGLPPGV